MVALAENLVYIRESLRSHLSKKKKPPSEGGFFFFERWLLIAPAVAARAGYAATHPRQLGWVFCREISGATWAGWGWQGEKGAAGRSAGSDRRRCARRAPALRVAGSGAARGGLRRCAWRAPALRVAGRSMSLVRAVLGA